MDTTGCFHFEVDTENQHAKIIGTKKTTKKIKALLDLLCKQQLELRALEDELLREIEEVKELETVREGAHTCRITVMKDLVRFVIGKSGSNIKRAKAIEGIIDIQIREES